MPNAKLYSALALTGTLPFIACAVLALFGIGVLAPFGALDRVVSSYGLAIVCFLAGTHWGLYFSGRSEESIKLLLRATLYSWLPGSRLSSETSLSR